jgi:hypothetical protein
MTGHIKWSVHISFDEIGKKYTDIAPRKGEPSKFRVGLKIQAGWLVITRLTEAAK